MRRDGIITAVPTLGTTWRLQSLPDFKGRHGDIAISLSVRTMPFQCKDQPFGAAIYHAAQIWPSTAGIKLCDEGELLPVCIPELLDQRQGPAQGMSSLVHLHLSSRPDAWRHWYQAQNKEYIPIISGEIGRASCRERVCQYV